MHNLTITGELLAFIFFIQLFKMYFTPPQKKTFAAFHIENNPGLAMPSPYPSRRNARGVSPVMRRNTAAKWLASAKPTRAATS